MGGQMGSVSALQAALAAENAAIFGYGVAGAHLTGSSLAAAEQDWTGAQPGPRHAGRDDLRGGARRRPPRRPSTSCPSGCTTRPARWPLAAYLEDGVTRAYLGLVAVSDQRLRRFGAMAMQDAAQRAASWRGSTQAFPGLTPVSSMIAAAISSSRRSAP